MGARKLVYRFEKGDVEGSSAQREILGGKGANLAEMARIGVRIPPGFTISTEACNFYNREGSYPPGLLEEIEANLGRLEESTGKGFGDARNPLLVSVRSGAPVSMPGMMDTILNLGLNDETARGLARRTGNERFAYDSYRRLLQMFGDVVLGIEHRKFESVLEEVKREKGIESDTALELDDIKRVLSEYRRLITRETDTAFPSDPHEQLHTAIRAVFRSWNNPRAQEYRAISRIPDHIGTGVNVQSMVFGNLGDDSGTGVFFTRSPSTGERCLYGEYLLNAQGEDLVAGIRTPYPMSSSQAEVTRGTRKGESLPLERRMPETYAELREIAHRLEGHFREMQDIEFTIEEGKLYVLQTRTGKRTAQAALKIAVDMVEEELITEDEAVLRIDPHSVNRLLHPQIDRREQHKYEVIAEGLAASPGAATGVVVFRAQDAVALTMGSREGKIVRKDLPIIVTEETMGPLQPGLEVAELLGQRLMLASVETSPDDVAGMEASSGVLTARGGMTSHAAIVARERGKPAVVGCDALDVDEEGRVLRVKKPDGSEVVVRQFEPITIDGSTGKIYKGQVRLVESEIIQVLKGVKKPEESELYGYYARLMSWVDERRRLGIRANADTPEDAEAALQLGAEGIGLCRTEHMFFEDRLPYIQKMIVAEDERGRKEALHDLLPMQRGDFKEIFQTMKGKPVTIRLLDAPLHEFLPASQMLIINLFCRDIRAQIETIVLGIEGRREGDERTEATLKDVLKLFDTRDELTKLKERISDRALDVIMGKVGQWGSVEGREDAYMERLKVFLERVKELEETNPMMGHRGCRLGITYPEVTEMQVRAIFEAACEVAKESREQGNQAAPQVEIMVPLVGDVEELRNQKAIIEKVGQAVMEEQEVEIHYLIGSMIELPRAAVTAAKIAEEADFFSFGTNDLTQTTFGFSRDDAEFKFLQEYRNKRILVEDPFVTIDEEGVGRLVRIGTEEGRSAKSTLKVGVCGEHGGEARSIDFFHQLGMDYVSCSPYRIPVARIGAAHAALGDKKGADAAGRREPIKNTA